MKNKKKLILGILIVVGIVVATIGVTYSIFNYTKHGSTESVINTGGISFYYDEMTKRGVSITDALPVDSNNDAKSSSNYFEFRITANTKLAEIPYVLTARLSDDSNMPLTGIRVYLTKVNDGVESEVLYTTLDQLVEKQFLGNYTDKVLYRDRVGVDGNSYEQKYRLRIWIDEDVNFSTGEWNDKRLSLQVNVYTNEGESLTEEHITYPGDTRVKMITGNNQYLLAESSEENVDYEVVVPNEVDSISFDTITQNMLADVTVTSLGTTPVSNSQNYNLVVGSNYFRVSVVSADSLVTKNYKVKVERELSKDNTLTYLEVEGYAFTEEFDKDVTNYTLSNGVELNSITISANNPNGATITGTGEKTLTWGENTFTITVQAQDPTIAPKTYTIVVNNVRPAAPAITGGTGTDLWTTTAQTISIESPGTAVSGVDHYEYYKTTSSTVPTDATTGITLSSPYEVEVTEGGTTYVYYRTVSNNGNKSLWSSAQVVNKNYTLGEKILADNTLQTATPDLTTIYPSITSYTDNNFNESTSTRTMSATYQGYYYTYASSYTFNTTTGKYTLVNPQVCKYSECYNTLKNKYVVNYFGSSSSTAASSSNLSTIYKVTADSTLDTLYYIASTKTINYDSSKSGLYSLAVTGGHGGSNGTTYYFRGDVTNNYVDFAGKVWRIVRINEDGTVRLILDDAIDTKGYAFNSTANNYTYMYYTNSEIKPTLDVWYSNNITGTNATRVVTGNYFCEAAKVKYLSSYTSGSATMAVYNSYTPDLTCQTDGNSKGLVNASVGLITYDEVVRAGGYYNTSNSNYYLYKNFTWWTMSPTGVRNTSAYVWYVRNVGGITTIDVYTNYFLRPVINLKSTVIATGTGTASDPYVVQ